MTRSVVMYDNYPSNSYYDSLTSDLPSDLTNDITDTIEDACYMNSADGDCGSTSSSSSHLDNNSHNEDQMTKSIPCMVMKNNANSTQKQLSDSENDSRIDIESPYVSKMNDNENNNDNISRQMSLTSS